MTIPKKRILPLLALSGLVPGALVVRLLVFKCYLPLVDWGDELNVLKRDGPVGLFRQPCDRNNYHFSLEPFRWHRLFYGGLIAGGVALGMSWWRCWKTVKWRAMPVLAVYAASAIFVVSSHTTIWEIDLIRYVLPVTLALQS